jgi:hypothetical protein
MLLKARVERSSIKPKGFMQRATMVFFGGFFLGSVKRPHVQLSSPDRQKG